MGLSDSLYGTLYWFLGCCIESASVKIYVVSIMRERESLKILIFVIDEEQPYHQKIIFPLPSPMQKNSLKIQFETKSFQQSLRSL